MRRLKEAQCGRRTEASFIQLQPDGPVRPLSRAGRRLARRRELLYADDLLKTPQQLFARRRLSGLPGVFGHPKTGNDISILPDPLRKAGASKPFIRSVRTTFNEGGPQFWPTTAAGSRTVKRVRPVRGVCCTVSRSRRQTTSLHGGRHAVAMAEGCKELFYVAADNRQMAATVDSKGGVLAVKKSSRCSGRLAMVRQQLRMLQRRPTVFETCSGWEATPTGC